jgi:hypothetical protein
VWLLGDGANRYGATAVLKCGKKSLSILYPFNTLGISGRGVTRLLDLDHLNARQITVANAPDAEEPSVSHRMESDRTGKDPTPPAAQRAMKLGERSTRA